MSRCLGRPQTSLELYARSMSAVDDEPQMLFPMYTVAAERLLELTEIEPHEILKARGDVVVFDDSMGNAGFVSHQWVAEQHPDPEMRQMQVFQCALRRFMKSTGSIPLDWVTEVACPNAKAIPLQDLQSRALFLWYDYFSVPQLEKPEVLIRTQGDGSLQAMAIDSIPGYIAKCRYFFALCPTIECQDRLLNVATWARRGWCRVERASRQFSEHDTWILVQSPTVVHVAGGTLSFPPGSVGEGEFTIESDRARLAPVMKAIVERKLRLSLKAGDLPSYRRYLNLQAVHFRGFNVEPVNGIALDNTDGTVDVVASFLLQNGFTGPKHRNAAGWLPIHYAAMSGNVKLVEGLLLQRADLHQRTSKDEPKLGLTILLSALDVAIAFKHNDVARLLIAARASMKGGLGPTSHAACHYDNAEGVRLLCENGSDPYAKNLFGTDSLENAAGYGAKAVVQELLRQKQPSPMQLSQALHGAMVTRGGSAELVHHLVCLRANVDHQSDSFRDLSRLGRFVFGLHALKHRFGRKTELSACAYHKDGRTPLMAALQMAQYEAAAALIAAGARLDARNARGFTARDFAGDWQSLPSFLQSGLEGERADCERVSSLALTDDSIIEMRV